MVTSKSVTALLTTLQHLRELRLAHCTQIDDSAFMSLPPTMTFDSLRILDLTACENVRDESVEKIVQAAPRLRNLVLAKCRFITDRSVMAICRLGKNLHYVHLGHCSNISDAAVIALVKSCNRIRYIDLACCNRLTDHSVQQLATLPKLRRIGLVKCQAITDQSILALARPRAAQHHHSANHSSSSSSLERVHLSYCVQLRMDVCIAQSVNPDNVYANLLSSGYTRSAEPLPSSDPFEFDGRSRVLARKLDYILPRSPSGVHSTTARRLLRFQRRRCHPTS